MKFIIAILFSSTIFLAHTCNKKITVLNPELKRLFGRWELIETSGGFTGKFITPKTSGHFEEIEFTMYGNYIKYETGNLSDKKKFNISEEKSIFNKNPVYIISYSDADSSLTRLLIPQSVRFGGADTLYLNEECYDCFSHVYVRKK
ncbi:MAG: hypothetical protein JJE25_01180 [Bacteroidia bacterium]|nr:hypothetical protein [Bacteroidia bacterium]